MALNDWPVAALVNSILAPAMTAPVTSVTVPVRDAVPWLWAESRGVRANARMAANNKGGNFPLNTLIKIQLLRGLTAIDWKGLIQVGGENMDNRNCVSS